MKPRLWDEGGIIHRWGTADPQVVVMGSSHALMYAAVIDSICRSRALSVAFFSADATPVFIPSGPSPQFKTHSEADEFDTARIGWVKRWRPAVVILADRWDGRQTDFEPNLLKLLRTLSPLAGRILLFTQPPVLQFGDGENPRDFVTRAYRKTGKLPRIPPDEREDFRRNSVQIFEKAAKAFPNVSVVHTGGIFYRPDGTVRYSSGRSFLYADADHLSDAGAEMAGPLIAEAIREGTGFPAAAHGLEVPVKQSSSRSSAPGRRVAAGSVAQR